LSDEGKAGAIKKIQSAKLSLVAPTNAREWDFNLPAKYDLHHRYANIKLFTQKANEKALDELARPRNRDAWEMGPLVVNAYYDPANNNFVLLNGILQTPFYDPSLPESEGLGAIGAVSGHELGHSIDDQGAKFDETGRLRPWLSSADQDEFHKRGEKIVARFNGAGHNGKLTLGENIGDHVGLHAAYRAAFYGKQATSKQKQDFFIQYARVWCSVLRPSLQEYMLKTNPHALGEARVNQQVKDLDGFQDSFACKKGDAMYLAPDDRISVW
jgi:putative endopeptidase